MKQWKSEDSIPPEYARALGGLIEELTQGINELESINDYSLEQGKYCKITKRFESKHIVAGELWRWNQAKSRKTVQLTNESVMFYKLTPRKRRSFPKGVATPRCKLWQFVITPFDTLQKQYKVLYCEKGVTQTITAPYNPSDRSFGKLGSCVFPPADFEYGISLDDLSFLAPFMDNQLTASTLWPDIYQTPYLI